MLKAWAERLIETRWARETIELHIKDTVAAFLAGALTQEGGALARYYARAGSPSEVMAGAAAIARFSECDDIHLASCVTPGAAVVPVALAFAGGCGEEQFHRAIAAGYAAGLTLGVGIGGAKALGSGVWPSLLAAPVMVAVTVSSLKGFNASSLAHAIALALSGASGRLGRPHGSPSGRWFAFAEAVLRGIRAAEAAEQGFRGDLDLVSKSWLAAQAGHADVDLGVFQNDARSILDVGFKPFPIARQGANAVVAFQTALPKGIDPSSVEAVEVHVPAANTALLSRPASAEDRLSLISNVGFQLACAALAPETLYDLERNARSYAPLLEFAGRVSVKPAPDLEAHFPNRWTARVVIRAGKNRFEETVVRAPFDHDSGGLQQLLEEKWRHVLPDNEQHQILKDTTGRPALLWQEIQRCVSMAAKRL